MRFSLLSTASLLIASTSAIPSPYPLKEIRQSSTTPIDTNPLLIGACLAIGTCYYGTNQLGCYTHGCADQKYLGGLCSCNESVQSVMDVQKEKGEKLWPKGGC